MIRHKVFISYHHHNDQAYKDALVDFGEKNNIFIDASVGIGEISDDLDDQSIRAIIRDHYLRDSTVTILLVGTETRYRKHIDWELYSSMIDGSINKRSGILVIHLPHVSSGGLNITAAHDSEKVQIHTGVSRWISINSREEYEKRYPYLPDRIIDNLLNSKAKVSVINWDQINIQSLPLLIENAHSARETNGYDLHREMRRRNG